MSSMCPWFCDGVCTSQGLVTIRCSMSPLVGPYHRASVCIMFIFTECLVQLLSTAVQPINNMCSEHAQWQQSSPASILGFKLSFNYSLIKLETLILINITRDKKKTLVYAICQLTSTDLNNVHHSLTCAVEAGRGWMVGSTGT